VGGPLLTLRERLGGLTVHPVVLDDPVPDGTPVVFNPSLWYAAIRPGSPSSFDENKTTFQVEGAYHPQITFNTRITHQGRSLFVRGIQDLDERHEWLVLLCEEVKTP